MIYDLKRSVDLRWLFDPVLHSSLDDLVCICIFQDIISAPPISWMTEDQTCDRPICTDSVRANKAQDFHPEGEMHQNVSLTIESINSWHWAKRDTSLEVWNHLLGQEAPKSYIRLFKTQNACRVGLRKKWEFYFVFQNLWETEKCKSQRILFHLWHSFYVSPLYWSEKSHRAPHDT